MPGVDPFASAAEMLRALRDRSISSLELLELHLSRRELHNQAINAIVIMNDEVARESARAADAARARGNDDLLLGLPMTVKDWLETAGWRSTAGDPSLAGYVAQSDGPVVARFRDAGAVIMGKTNQAVWGGDWQSANPVFGRSNNPWDLERTPGGSTGGGAAALAAGLTPLELGNDIGGSVRVPPAFSGVYGHRPSETAWPRSGQLPDPTGQHLPNPATGMGVAGPLARSADDLALALQIGCGPEPGEDTAWRLHIPPARRDRLEGFRVAVMPNLPWLPVDDEIIAARDRLAADLGRLGARVATAQPDGFDDLLQFHQTYWSLLATMMMGNLSRRRRREISKWARAEAIRRDDPIMAAGARAFEARASDYLGWYYQRERYRASYRSFFRDWDILLTPVAFTNAFRHDEAPIEQDPDDRYLQVNGQKVPYNRLAVYAGLATLCGQPATAFPFGLTQSGLPIGLQAIGPYLEDYTPIRFAGLVGREFGGFRPPPGYRTTPPPRRRTPRRRI